MAKPFTMKEDNERAILPADIEAALSAGLPAEAVSAEQARRIRGKIDEALDYSEASTTRRLEDEGWIRRSADCEIKILNYDQATGLHSFLMRLQPDAIVDPHAHHLTEECVILSGEIEVDGLTLKPGDYQMFNAGTEHSRIVSRTGALMFVRAELELAA